MCKHKAKDFLGSQDKRNLLIQLFNSEIRNAAIGIGLRHAWRNKNQFFYPTDRAERYETWESRFKKTRKRVANKIYVRELGRSLYAHDAALVLFHFVGEDVYLVVLPRIVLTHDGFETISGFREGPVKTRLSYNKFNDGFLNLVLFWISRFRLGQRDIDLGGRILISGEPATVTLDIGIRQDRPATEFRRRKDELYSFEAVDII